MKEYLLGLKIQPISQIEVNTYVSSITNVISNNQSESFVLNLCSREAITNETARVPVKFPTSSPIPASAEKIIKDYLRTPKTVEVDKTMNKYGFIGNMRKPFTVLTWLYRKVSQKLKEMELLDTVSMKLKVDISSSP